MTTHRLRYKACQIVNKLDEIWLKFVVLSRNKEQVFGLRKIAWQELLSLLGQARHESKCQFLITLCRSVPEKTDKSLLTW